MEEASLRVCVLSVAGGERRAGLRVLETGAQEDEEGEEGEDVVKPLAAAPCRILGHNRNGMVCCKAYLGSDSVAVHSLCQLGK